MEKMTKSPAHRIATYLLCESLRKNIPHGWYVDSQEPVTLIAGEPEPDAVVKAQEAIRGITATEIRGQPMSHLSLKSPIHRFNAIVVSKKWLYASAGINVYWIVNLVVDRATGDLFRLYNFRIRNGV